MLKAKTQRSRSQQPPQRPVEDQPAAPAIETTALFKLGDRFVWWQPLDAGVDVIPGSGCGTRLALAGSGSAGVAEGDGDAIANGVNGTGPVDPPIVAAGILRRTGLSAIRIRGASFDAGMRATIVTRCLGSAHAEVTCTELPFGATDAAVPLAAGTCTDTPPATGWNDFADGNGSRTGADDTALAHASVQRAVVAITRHLGDMDLCASRPHANGDGRASIEVTVCELLAAVAGTTAFEHRSVGGADAIATDAPAAIVVRFPVNGVIGND